MVCGEVEKGLEGFEMGSEDRVGGSAGKRLRLLRLVLGLIVGRW
jgi:hypothetical protein